MSDLIRATGVSRQTIHHYLREGLLLPPVHVSRNMAQYDVSTIDDILLIKELQEKRYLPLAVIKEVLKARREGHDLAEQDHLSAMDDLFTRVKDVLADDWLDEAAFLDVTGLEPLELEAIISIGVITPNQSEIRRCYDGFDVRIGRTMRSLISLGLTPKDLRIYGTYLRWARGEATLMHDQIIHRAGGTDHPPLKEINAVLMDAKLLLTAKAYREMLATHRHGLQRESEDFEVD